MAITSTGLATGMNINNIVQQLVNAEGQPAKALLDRQQTRLDTKLSGLGRLKGALSSFQSSLKNLGAIETFSARKTSVSDERSLSIKASSSAAIGTYRIEVLKLAQAGKQISAGFASSDVVVGEGALTLSVGGNSFSVTIGAANHTLMGIRDAINQAADNTGVSATIVNVDDGLGGTVSKLLLSANKTGTAHALGVSISDVDGNNNDNTGLSGLLFTSLVAAQDAHIRVDGQDVTRVANVIDDAIEGLSFNLKAVTSTPIVAEVKTDTEDVAKALQGFVDAYNSLRQVMDDLGRYDPVNKKAAELTGDALLRNIQQQLRRELTANVSTASSEIDSLAAIGIQIDRYGVMALDRGKLDQVMRRDPAAVANLFASADGIATRTQDRINTYLKSGGLIDTQVRSMSEQKRQIADRRAAVDTRLSKIEGQYLRQFNKMDQIVDGYQRTGSYLAAQLVGLSK